MFVFVQRCIVAKYLNGLTVFGLRVITATLHSDMDFSAVRETDPRSGLKNFRLSFWLAISASARLSSFNC